MEGIKSSMNSVSNSVSNVTSNVSEKVSNSFSSLPKPEFKSPTIPSIVNPLEKTNTEKVMDKFSLSSTKISPSTSSGPYLGYGFKFFLLFVIIVLLIVNLWAYLEKGTDVFSSKLRGIFVTTGDGVLDTIQKTFDNLVSGTRFGKGVIYDSVSSSLNLMKSMLVTKFKKNEKVFIKQEKESKLEKKINKKEELKEEPNEDSSESNIQNHVKGSYCFVGNQTPHNACVEVSDTTKCMSGKLFKTLKECESHNQMKWTQEE